MNNLILETTIKNIFPKLRVNDKLMVINDKEFTFNVYAIKDNLAILDLNGNSKFAIKNNSLQGTDFYMSKLPDDGSGQYRILKNVLEIRIIRGYDTIETVSTRKPKLNEKQEMFIKEIKIDVSEELKKANINDTIIIETAFLKATSDDKTKESEFIDEQSITKFTLKVLNEYKLNYLTCIVENVKGYQVNKFSSLINNEIIINKIGLSLNNSSNQEDGGIYLKFKTLNGLSKISNIINIEVIVGEDDTDEDPNVKHYTDKEIFNIVSRDPVMSKLLNTKPGFWDFILGGSGDRSAEDIMSNLRDIRSNVNKGSKTTKGLNDKVYTIIYNGNDVDKNPNLKLIKGNKYTAIPIKGLSNNYTLAIYPFNNRGNTHNVYTMDFKDPLRKGPNKGELFFGGKTPGKTRNKIGDAEITIR